MTCVVANVCFKTCSRQHPILSKHNDMGNYRLHETTDAIALMQVQAKCIRKEKVKNDKSHFCVSFLLSYNYIIVIIVINYII